MMLCYRNLISAALLYICHVITIIRPAEALKCLQCMALLHDSSDCSAGRLDATECKSGFKYCIRYVGNMNSGRAVFRDCSMQDMQDLCSIKEIAQQKVHVCYTTCSADGCNGGPVSGTISSRNAKYHKVALISSVAVTLIFANIFNHQLL